MFVFIFLVIKKEIFKSFIDIQTNKQKAIKSLKRRDLLLFFIL
jgi:hypothetical protein